MKLNEGDLLYPKQPLSEDDPHWAAEWLFTNGIGGYSSGAVTGLNTRGYHGYLIAALPAPFGRTVMVNELYEAVILPDGSEMPLNPDKQFVKTNGKPAEVHTSFRLELGVPVWTYQAGNTSERFTVERRIWLVHSQNTVFIEYRLLAGPSKLRLKLRPALNLRSHEAPVSTPLSGDYALTVKEDRYEICSSNGLPPLRLQMIGQSKEFTIDRKRVEKIGYRTEADRGYAAVGELWIPGSFSADLELDAAATMVASTEPWDAMSALTPAESLKAEYIRRRRLLTMADPRACGHFGEQLILAADQFLITPAGRIEDAIRAHAAGDEIRTVIAGYHWFTDWGRDTMISLEGLTLCTGRTVEASYILSTFAHSVRDGLIPNMFPEGGRGGLYHTADATLWFFHAIDRYIQGTGDRQLLLAVMPTLLEIMRRHMAGTCFGIHMDPADALLSQGETGYQLTWMDAKVDGWVVTPRRGKAVEINALWYNALRLMQRWTADQARSGECPDFAGLADRAESSFNERFWIEESGYLYDVIDGPDGEPDALFRPNQIFSIALPHPVLRQKRWEPVLAKVKERLLTPVGLRSLAPGSKDYRSRYDGDLRSRDAAYHQGTVWGWLIGPFIDAWLKVYPDDHAAARAFLEGFRDNLAQSCVGSLNEVFDAEAPYTPRGCIAQAWSVAEVLRGLVKTAAS